MSCWDDLLSIADTLVPLPGPEGLRMRFRPIPRGEFVMGSRGYSEREEPPHRVVIPHDFYLGKYVVTQREWRTLVEALGPAGLATSPSCLTGDWHPVDYVSWDEVQVWLTAWWNWLAKEHPPETNDVVCLRLPTEAEWEYACRAGSDTVHWNGDGEQALAEVGWYAGNSGYSTHDVREEVMTGVPEKHPAGLSGTHGNVWEWCADKFDAHAYRKREDGWRAIAPWDAWDEASQPFNVRSTRGGSWGDAAWGACRASFRSRGPSDSRHGHVGFRVCLVRGPAADKQTVGGGAAAGRKRAEADQAEPGQADGTRPRPGGAGEAAAPWQGRRGTGVASPAAQPRARSKKRATKSARKSPTLPATKPGKKAVKKKSTKGVKKRPARQKTQQKPRPKPRQKPTARPKPGKKPRGK